MNTPTPNPATTATSAATPTNPTTTASTPRPIARRAALVVLVLVVAVLGAVAGRISAAPHASDGGLAPGPVDVGFSQDMATHHEQAIMMATLASGRAGPTVSALASSILAAQAQELGSLQGWLGLWGQPLTSPHPMAWMPGGMGSSPAPTNGGVMPGMASPEELTTLWTKTGNDFDVMFLQLMIRHHQGGIMMARAGAENARLDIVSQAARTMQIDQTEEIGQMQALLTADNAAPLPTP